MGWVTRSENVCFEVWRFSVTLLDASVGDGIAAIAAVAGTSEEKAAQYKSAYDQVTAAMLKVFEVSDTDTASIAARVLHRCAVALRHYCANLGYFAHL